MYWAGSRGAVAPGIRSTDLRSVCFENPFHPRPPQAALQQAACCFFNPIEPYAP